MKTQVAIIGGGPSGLLLSQLLMQAGIETIVLERQTRAHVLSRIRAGVLESGTVQLLKCARAAGELEQHGLPHDGCTLAFGERQLRIDFEEACGRKVMVYGQTEVTRNLYAVQDAAGATIYHEVEDVVLHGLESDSPAVTFRHGGQDLRVDCAYIAGCDGFHGVSRTSIPTALRREYEKVYPFGWLGILSETPPAAEELIYARSPRGFALASLRNPMLSRSYIQVPLLAKIEDWPDEMFWEEFRARLPAPVRDTLITGPSVEKSIAPLRSFVCEPMQFGRLFLCGDAAHIVPPTGAKGLNLAASDVFYLSRALIARHAQNDDSYLMRYGADALARVWLAMRFSWQMTMMMHLFPDQGAFDQRVAEAEFDLLCQSPAARQSFAENYTGLPF